jgi:hypothetical protein
MPWQDWVLSIGCFLILLSLIPTIRGDQKPALTTSVMSAAIVAVFAFTMTTLGLWISGLANGGIAIAWSVLAVQRYQIVRREKQEGLIAQIEEEVDVTLGLEDEATSDQPETEPRPA